MNHKLNKKKVAFVIIIAVLIISLGVFLFNNVNQSTKKETPKKESREQLTMSDFFEEFKI